METPAPDKALLRCIYCGEEFDPAWQAIHIENCAVIQNRRKSVVQRVQEQNRALRERVMSIVREEPTLRQFARYLKELGIPGPERRSILRHFQEGGTYKAIPYVRGYLGVE